MTIIILIALSEASSSSSDGNVYINKDDRKRKSKSKSPERKRDESSGDEVQFEVRVWKLIDLAASVSYVEQTNVQHLPVELYKREIFGHP